MNTVNCEHLDDYLSRELDEQARGQFEEHLRICRECRAEVALQRSIDAALVAGHASVKPSAALIPKIESRLHHKSAKRRTWLVAAAAAVLILAGSLSYLSRGWRGPANGLPDTDQKLAQRKEFEKQERAEPKQPVVDRQHVVEITFPTNQDIIANELATDDPAVTILMLYPAITRDSSGD
jgi:anti-sigma factor RsiW